MSEKKMGKLAIESFAAYVEQFPPPVQRVLRRCRATIKRAAPNALEVISYRMPAFKLNGRILVYFAAFKGHLGLYPPVRDDSLQRRVARYAGPKGNLRFRYEEPIPYDLIARIVRTRIASKSPQRIRS